MTTSEQRIRAAAGLPPNAYPMGVRGALKPPPTVNTRVSLAQWCARPELERESYCWWQHPGGLWFTVDSVDFVVSGLFHSFLLRFAPIDGRTPAAVRFYSNDDTRLWVTERQYERL